MYFLRWFLITGGALMLTTVGIFAFDESLLPLSSLMGSAYESVGDERCGAGMAFVGSSNGGFCIDVYEVSASSSCEHTNPQSRRETNENLERQSCTGVSVEDATPWTNITRHQAELACSRVKKRLPTAEEWYKAALGTPDDSGDGQCNLYALDADSPEKTGNRATCVSPIGAYDMIGNVWEWLEETVENGQYGGSTLPDEGYVSNIYTHGLPQATAPDGPDAAYFDDYFWVSKEGLVGIIRGGFWKSQSDGGLYAANVTVDPNFYGEGVGFRCAKSVE